MLTNPLKDFEAIHLWHFEVKEDEVGEREFIATGVFAKARQVSERLFAVANDVQRDGYPGSGKSPADEEDVVLKILGQKNDAPLRHIWTHVRLHRLLCTICRENKLSPHGVKCSGGRASRRTGKWGSCAGRQKGTMLHVIDVASRLARAPLSPGLER